MKHVKEMLFLVVLLLTPLFIAGIGISPSQHEESILKPDLERVVKKSYDPHSEIRIDNDTDFYNQAMNESWSGDGSEELPYIIEGYSFVASYEAIYIQDTRSHFIIQDCYITIDNGYSYPAIMLINATNGVVRECVIDHCQVGIYGLSVHNIVVEGCAITDCSSYGIEVAHN